MIFPPVPLSLKFGGIYHKIGKVDEVKVPAGTFRNVVTSSSDNLDSNGQKIGLTYYFAKDVGIVKQTVVTEGLNVIMELDRFERKK